MSDVRVVGEREVACDAPPMPTDLATKLGGYLWYRDRVGEAGAAVYRLQSGSAGRNLYLKHGCGSCEADVTDEMARLRWLHDHMPVPSVCGFVLDDAGAWLLTKALPGRTAYEVLESDKAAREAVVDALAGFLRRLHALPAATCPFNSGHHLRLAAARRRMEAGLVDVEDFDDQRLGWSAERVWAEMHALLPLSPDPVVTHGDFSLDNLLVREGSVTGCIDVGRLGVADRYQDLAIVWNCIGEFGGGLQRRFLDSYGLPRPDQRKMQFHLLLDEFF